MCLRWCPTSVKVPPSTVQIDNIEDEWGWQSPQPNTTSGECNGYKLYTYVCIFRNTEESTWGHKILSENRVKKKEIFNS